MSGFIPRKNPSQKFRKKQGMVSGMQFKEHMAHLRTATEKVGESRGLQAVAPNKA